MIDHLSPHQFFNLWLIMFALSFGWNVGKGVATPVIRFLRRRASLALIRMMNR
jgi:hypothetical protein